VYQFDFGRLDQAVMQRFEQQDLPLMFNRDVLKGNYHELMYLTAFLCGGWAHMRYISAEYRQYDFEKADK